MTEQELRQKVVDTAKSYLGYKEADGSHKKIIDLYNSQKPLPVGYKVTYTDAWCATFVSAVGVKLGLTDIILPECGCGRMIALYQKAGRWQESDAYVPAPGDIIMYDWQDTGVGDNTGAADHVGIVCGVSGNTITVIEGNKSDAVGYRTLQVNGRYIRGYCLPNYASKATAATTPAPATPAATDPELESFKALWYKMRKELQDNDSSAYSEEARKWATEKGLIVGGGKLADGSANFMWEDVLTREQMVTLLYRFAQIIGKA